MKFVQAFVLSQKEEDLEALATLLTERKFYCAFLGCMLYILRIRLKEDPISVYLTAGS
jgi:hypothetical protein